MFSQTAHNYLISTSTEQPRLPSHCRDSYLAHLTMMPSFIYTFAINALLAGALVAQIANAYPQPAVADAAVLSEGSDPPGVFYEEVESDIVKRSKTLKIGAKPDKSHTCPKTDRYAKPVEYSSGQLQKAFIQAAQYANDGKQIGASE